MQPRRSDCRQAIENRDGSSASPIVPLRPPVRAWLTWHWIIEGADAHAVVADEPEGRADARQVVGARRDSPAEEASHAEQGEQSGSEHMLAHAASARAGISRLPRRLAPEAVVDAVAASATGSRPRESCARTNAATRGAISRRKREPLKMP